MASMRIGLTDAEQTVSSEWSYAIGLTLAWRAFSKAIGIELDDPLIGMDGDGIQREPVTGRYFHFELANGDRYLSLGHYGCWDNGALRSLSPRCTYVSYSIAPDGSYVDFHGWHQPKRPARIITPTKDGLAPSMNRHQLTSMATLIDVMRRSVVHTGKHVGSAAPSQK